MSGILRAYLAIFLPVLLSGLVLGWVGCALRAHWRDKPVPYLPTDKAIDGAIATVTCPWCRPVPVGRCTCGIACRHERCVRLSPGRPGIPRRQSGDATVIVVCARCLTEHTEDSPDVLYASGDWWCRDEAACGDRMTALLLGEK